LEFCHWKFEVGVLSLEIGPRHDGEAMLQGSDLRNVGHSGDYPPMKLMLPLAFSFLALNMPAQTDNRLYPGNLPPLKSSSLIALPVGAVKPAGWLKDQLTIQANGLTGHLDEFWPSLRDSAWKGGAGDAWERGPYYLDGLVPLAYQLDDAKLKGIAQRYLDCILASGQPNGWFGPTKNKDRWPLSVAMKVLTQYYEATGDERVMALLKNYFRYLRDNPPDWPDKEWRGVRAMENVVPAYWLYNRTGDADILKVAESIQKNSFDWTGYFIEFPYRTPRPKEQYKPMHPTHVVNIAMAVKHPGVWYQQSGEERFKRAVYDGIKHLDEFHGQVGGRFGGDEHLAGRNPTQGTELCAIVEYMYSLEKLVEALGDPVLADRLEMLAYNCQPATCTPRYWAHQYDQQANQVLVTQAKRKWTTNGDGSNLYGLEPNFGCCTANMHQGWPKLVAHLWMATADRGLAAVAYGPCEVKAKVGEGVPVTLVEQTEYPFDGEIKITVDIPKPTSFPLRLRIPGWAEGATINAPGAIAVGTPGAFIIITRTWKSGDQVRINLPMKLRTEARFNNAVSLLRGPLYFSLKIGEQYKTLKTHHDILPVVDWEILPTTPWNYGLLVDRQNPAKSIKVKQRKVGKVPFDGESPPVVLTAKGKRIPAWGLEQNSAADTPASPVKAVGPTETLQLIPYGNTRLRITEFPVVE
jgi:hypothetical protein